MGPFWDLFFGIVFVLIFSAFGFSLGNYWYDNLEVELSFLEMEQAISDLKRKKKGVDPKKPRDRINELYKKHLNCVSFLWGYLKLVWGGITSCFTQLWRSLRNCLGFEEESMMNDEFKSDTINE